MRVYGNRAVIEKGPYGPRWWSHMYAWQPLAISVESGHVSFRWADLAPVTTEPLDPDADWQHPARLRLSFWNAPPPTSASWTWTR